MANRSCLIMCASLGVLTGAGAVAAQSCQPFWGDIPIPLPQNTGRWTVFDDGFGPTVYAGVGFQQISYVRWRHRQWEPITTQGLPPVRLASDGQIVLDDGGGPALYSLVEISSSMTQPMRYRNGTWEPMPLAFWQYSPGGDYKPDCSADLGDGMHIYGRLPGRRVCRWNGSSWDQIGLIGSDTTMPIEGMIGYDDGGGPALFVLGDFQTVDGVVTNGFARWDGHQWTGPWPDGMHSYTGHPLLRVWDDGGGPKLYSNFMPTVGGTDHRGLHRWDGQTWDFLGGPDTLGPLFWGLYDFDDGSGPALYMSGEFSNFAGLNARNIVRYDRNGFRTVPGGEAFLDLTGFGVIGDERGESMVFSGGFRPAGSTSTTPRMAQIVGCPACPADCDASGALNVNDFICFMSAFAGADPFANAHPDNSLDVQDFIAFMNRFAAGCP